VATFPRYSTSVVLFRKIYPASKAFEILQRFLSFLPYYRKFQIYLMFFRPLVFLISAICVFGPFIIGSDPSDVNVKSAEKINNVVAKLQTNSRHRGSSAGVHLLSRYCH